MATVNSFHPHTREKNVNQQLQINSKSPQRKVVAFILPRGKPGTCPTRRRSRPSPTVPSRTSPSTTCTGKAGSTNQSPAMEGKQEKRERGRSSTCWSRRCRRFGAARKGRWGTSSPSPPSGRRLWRSPAKLWFIRREEAGMVRTTGYPQIGDRPVYILLFLFYLITFLLIK